MPKKTKIDPTPAAASTDGAPAAKPPVPGAQIQPRKRAAAPKSATRKVAAKKKAKTGGANKTAAKKVAQPAADPSDADIQLRAYFIAERRMQLSIPGDSAHDWLEAKRQLIEEAGQKGS